MKRVTPTRVDISLAALRSNYRRLRKKIPAIVKALCVVKSNAYGHGAAVVAKTLEKEGADFFGVGTVDEGIALRKAGIKKPILILLGFQEGHFETLLRHRLTPVLYDVLTASRLNAFLKKSRRPLNVHVKIDTGMTRLGLLSREWTSFFTKLKRLSYLKPTGLLTHLSDFSDMEFTRDQVRAFQKARDEFRKFFREPLCHVSNSYALLDGKIWEPSDSWMVRMGIALYGCYPTSSAKLKRSATLKPVLSWKTKVLAVKDVPARTSISYGRTFETRKKSRIVVLPVGYADGYPRNLSNRSQVLIQGKSLPVCGTICMDLMMVDATALRSVRVGEEVVLLGRQKNAEISAEKLAEWAGTIPYEIVTRIAERIPRVYR